GRQRDRPFDRGGVETTTGELVLEMDGGEHLGIAWRALGRNLDFATADGHASLFKNVNDIEDSAGAKPQEEHFERPYAEITPAASTGSRRDDRRLERAVDLVDEQPSAPVGHLHLPRGRRNGSGRADELEQPDLARSHPAFVVKLDAETRSRIRGHAGAQLQL